MARGWIDIKKHSLTAGETVYDVIIYTSLKHYPYTGKSQAKLRAKEVRKLIQDEDLVPTRLSERLYGRLMKTEE